jgi:MFS family permease
VRALASALAYTELAISITLVNEFLPSKRRGIYYPIVRAGWPIGVTLAAIIYLVTIQLGWYFLFVFGVAPFAVVVVGRIWIKEPERFRRIKEIRGACESGDDQKAERLNDRYDIPTDQARTYSFAELFGMDIRRQTILLSICSTRTKDGLTA